MVSYKYSVMAMSSIITNDKWVIRRRSYDVTRDLSYRLKKNHIRRVADCSEQKPLSL